MQTTDVWLYDVLRGTTIRLTFEGRNLSPIWSPDGKRLVYASNLSGHFNLYAVNVEGDAKVERLTTSEYDQFPSSWTIHGNLIAVAEYQLPTHNNRISVLSMDGDRTLKPVLESRSALFWPEFSPDGRWIAYMSEESGAPAVYVSPYVGPGEKHRISTDQGFEPFWMPNGRELLYRDRDRQKFFSVTITSQKPFRAETPRLLFDGKKYSRAAPVRGWDVSRDGQRFVIAGNEESQMNSVGKIEVVLNWAEELKRRVPAR
jgi:Tol biopolymer transport system component